MVAVPELAGGQRFPLGVVVAVGRGDDHGLGTRKLEDHALRRAQPGRVEVFDDLHQRRRVEALQPRVPVQERTLHEAQSGALRFREAVVVQPSCGDLERGRGYIHAKDAREGAFGLQQGEQPPLAAAKVQHACRPARPQRRQHSGQTLLVQAQRLFDRFLLAVAPLARPFGIVGGVGFLLDGQQAAQRLARQDRPVLEVAAHDGVALRVLRQPAFSLAHELVHLVVTDPVVLVVVQDRNEHVEVAQEVAQARGLAQGQRKVEALAPVGETFVQRMPLGFHFVA